MSYLEQLRDGASTLGLTIEHSALERLLAYHAELIRWNKAYNLSAIRDPAQMVTHHLLDSLSVWPHVEGPLADIGTGAGLPGVLLAIVDPALQVTSVETVGKKARFQRHIKRELSLDNLTVVDDRVENFHCEAGFATVTCRAFASLADFVRGSRHLLADDGRWVAMKGKHPADEIAALPRDVCVERTLPLTVPGLAAERCLVFMKQDRA